ncbi:MAG: hypothetical protein II915_01350 [Eubacterium sp.]|nr:hypothetical protein [Eubacterium sp.]
MRELKKDIENKKLTEVHPYKIYESKTVRDQWFTHLPNPTRPEKHRKVKHLSYKPKQNKQDEVFTFDQAQKLLAYLRTIEDDPYALAIKIAVPA